MMDNPVVLITSLAFATLLPFVLAAGSCFLKFSVVFSLLRNAIGLQQVPSNMVLNGIALLMAAFVMMPVFNQVQGYYHEQQIDLNNPASMQQFLDEGVAPYKKYLIRYADPDMVQFFGELHEAQLRDDADDAAPPRLDKDDRIDPEQASLLTLLPAYALSELKSAFEIGFYIYLPFLVIDMLVSNVLLALGMMMMSPVTIALPIKLILFVMMDGWNKVVKGLILQYIQLAH
ncbi:EscR/YscR/HrcR family type III secretion system export apparatus protein [Achromobacter xylosoxidans]|uniref:EscR/YscR/HrcR family type III secretion system export apparatus protein n=1 Tax=Alcaligenes xylosoxydans xylosoxydans TaxID=85698 RepID=UPI0012A8BE60|nr:EscR/YscR/HrcR family type III secretion system export apparatus protein [Achromobacter xylosoxidans]MCZ8438932.1 EscR/YscR/HrcR family type III secretion system export apparatus protein [Achromobacter xylosoxidans]MDC6162345.1 EscR/YscR/HrcR family type III secretion system export apparatus protein [Achromobacter xylosoxidans]CUR68103.1 Flagellar biosynthetic protein FliP precursor [Achromobacter xylosoxidans]